MSFKPGLYQPAENSSPDNIVIGTTGLSDVSNSLDPALAYNSYSLGFMDQVFEGTRYLDPTYANGTLGLELINLAYEGLVTYDGINIDSYKGLLANSWSISTNGTIYTFYLNHNVHYHDGTPFNAYTMKYSIDRLIIFNHKIGPVQFLDKYILGASFLLPISSLNLNQANNYLNAGGITALDEFTLQIKLTTPYLPFLSLLCYDVKAVSPYSVITHEPSSYQTAQANPSQGMISLHTMFPNFSDWAKLGLSSNHDPTNSGIVPQGDIYSDNWIDSHMVGTGPYNLTSNLGSELIFSKNNDWHESFTISVPDQITWSNADGIFGFFTGESDMLNTFDIRSSLSTFVDSEGKSIINGVTTYFIPSLINLRLVFNLNESLDTFIHPAFNISSSWNQTHITDDHLMRYSTNDSFLASIDNPFTAIKFREAFCYAFDYDTFINDQYNNLLANRSEGVIPFGMDGYQNQLIANNITASFNLTIAKNLFQEVGWAGNITLLHGSGTYGNGIRSTADVLLANAINSLNVGIHINAISDYNSLIANYTSLVYDKEGWGASYDDPFTAVFAQLDSHGPSSSEFSHYANPTIDELIHDSEIGTNSSSRMSLFKQIEETSAKDYPAINLANFYKVYVVNNSLNSLIQDFNPFISGFNFPFSNSHPTTSSSTSTSTNGKTPGFEVFPLIILVIPFLKRKSLHNKK